MTRCDLIVDGNALFAVGFFSVYNRADPTRAAPHYDRDYQPCGGIVSGCRRLLDLIADRQRLRPTPERLLVCFDGTAKTDKRRVEKPPGYHDELSRFQKAIPEIMGGKIYVATGAEADDAVATAVILHKRPGVDSCIVSTDKDLYQVVKPGVRYFCLRRKRIIEAEEFLKKIPCVRPLYLPIYLALAGDPIDGIKGVRHIGPKTASKLIETIPPHYTLAHAIHRIGKKFRRMRRSEYYTCVYQATLFGDHDKTPAPEPIVIPSTPKLRNAGWLSVSQEASRARRALEDASELEETIVR